MTVASDNARLAATTAAERYPQMVRQVVDANVRLARHRYLPVEARVKVMLIRAWACADSAVARSVER